MDDTETDSQSILADAATDAELTRAIITHAVIVQHLVCRMARQAHQSEAGIRALYETWADLAVEEFSDPQGFQRRKPH